MPPRSREIGDRRGEGNGLWNMSVSHERTGDVSEAIENGKAALNILEQIESP